MHWNLTAPNTLHIKTPEKWSFLWNEPVQIFKTQIQDFAASILTANWLEFCRRMQCVLPNNLNIMNNLFSRHFSLLNEILYQTCYCDFCIGIFHSGLIHTYKKARRQSTKTAVILNISLDRHKIWINEAMKICQISCSDMKHWSVQILFYVFHYKTAWIQHDSVLQYEQMCFVKCTDHI